MPFNCITAGNVAKYEALHAVVIFDEPDPLSFTREQVADYLDTGWRLAKRAHVYDLQACYFLFLWNAAEHAGTSIRHGCVRAVPATCPPRRSSPLPVRIPLR